MEDKPRIVDEWKIATKKFRLVYTGIDYELQTLIGQWVRLSPTPTTHSWL